jgi:hypothetical protein
MQDLMSLELELESKQKELFEKLAEKQAEKQALEATKTDVEKAEELQAKIDEVNSKLELLK